MYWKLPAEFNYGLYISVIKIYVNLLIYIIYKIKIYKFPSFFNQVVKYGSR